MTRMNRHAAAVVVGAVSLTLLLVAPGESAVSSGHRTRHAPRAAAVDGRIAFNDYLSQIMMTVNPDGTALVQVTKPGRDGATSGRPAWTPDGTHLVYSGSRHGGDYQIREIAADGTGGHVLVKDKPGYFDFLPRITPDGRWVLFDRCRPDALGDCAIYAATMGGKHLHPVVPYGSPRKDTFTSFFAISPNGRRLAFTRGGLHGIAQQVWVSRINGSHAHPVSKPAREFAVTDWMPDGLRLLVTGPNFHFGAALYVMPAAGGAATLLTKAPFPHQDFWGAVSPSGLHVAYLGDDDIPDLNGNHFFLVDTSGANRHRLDVGTDTVGEISWGIAPLLPASAATRPERRTPPLTSRAPGWLDPRAPAQSYLRGRHR